jgi:hypothetical protein
VRIIIVFNTKNRGIGNQRLWRSHFTIGIALQDYFYHPLWRGANANGELNQLRDCSDFFQFEKISDKFNSHNPAALLSVFIWQHLVG